MSGDPVRAALETALNAISPSLATAWENEPFEPATGVPYQRVNLLRAQPDDSESGSSFVEQGILQVTLCYPTGGGPASAEAHALAVREAFKRGSSFTSGGVIVTVFRVPQLMPPQVPEDRFELPIRITWRAQVNS